MDYTYVLLIVLIILICYRNNENFDNENINNKVRYNDAKLLLMYKSANLSKLKDNNKKKREMNKMENKKVCIVTYENRDLEYVNLHNLNTKKYCDKWNYDYKFVSENKSRMSPYWYKVYLVYEIINSNEYDYVFWMDSDTIINNFNIDLYEDIFSIYDSDIFVASDNINHDVVNAGLFVIKNSEKGKAFLRDWLQMYNKECEIGNGKLRGMWAMSCYEQGTLNELIINKYEKYTTFLDRNIFNNSAECNNDVFVTHYYAVDSEKRKKCFAKSKH